MLNWLKQVLAPREQPARSVVRQKHFANEAQGWIDALDNMEAGDAFNARLAEAQTQLASWYAQHPLKVEWPDAIYGFKVSDPLCISTENAMVDHDAPSFRAWAPLLRTVEITNGGDFFLDGVPFSAYQQLMSGPDVPRHVENLTISGLEYSAAAHTSERAWLIDSLNTHSDLKHLNLGSYILSEPGDVVRLSEAPWAASLRTLDFSEVMIDWTVDFDEASVDAAYRALGKFRSLTHLVMVNNFHKERELASFLVSTFPELTHLRLGAMGDDPFEVLLDRASALPVLEGLWVGRSSVGGEWNFDRALELPYPVYVHEKRVTADYPKRGSS